MNRTEPASNSTSAQALSRFATRVQRELGIAGEVSISVTSSREMQQLNRRFRRKNKPSDVLTFPSPSAGIAGDIAISLEIAASNAESLGHTPAEEVKILILHGLLHLAGYDHETDGGEMQTREAQLRKKYKLPVALIERTRAAENKEGGAVGRTLGPRRAPLLHPVERKRGGGRRA